MSRDDLIEMARLAGCGWAANGTKPMLLGEKQLERFAALVAAHERGECAEVCDAMPPSSGRYSNVYHDCAAAIRARGES